MSMRVKSMISASIVGNFSVSAREFITSHIEMVRHPEMAALGASSIVTRKLRDRLCGDDKIFVDVGAHIGAVINGAARHGNPPKIIAIEAMPDKAARLRAKFPVAEIHHCALGPVDSEVEFTIDLAHSGYSSLDPAVRGRTDKFRVITVPMKTLDQVPDGRSPDFIKIDVEGAELGVLRGGSVSIEAARPTIMFESGAHEMAGYSKEAMFHWFSERGYDLVLPIRLAHNAPPATLDVFLDAHEFPRRSLDWFAVARERRMEIRSRARDILGVVA